MLLGNLLHKNISLSDSPANIKNIVLSSLFKKRAIQNSISRLLTTVPRGHYWSLTTACSLSYIYTDWPHSDWISTYMKVILPPNLRPSKKSFLLLDLKSPVKDFSNNAAIYFKCGGLTFPALSFYSKALACNWLSSAWIGRKEEVDMSFGITCHKECRAGAEKRR